MTVLGRPKIRVRSGYVDPTVMGTELAALFNSSPKPTQLSNFRFTAN